MYRSALVLLSAYLLGSQAMNIVETAMKTPQLSTLAELVAKYELVDFLSNETLTVFAPTNEAFKGVNLTGIDNETVVGILKYHLVEGKIMSGDLTNGDVETVSGSNVTVSITTADNKTVVMINDATVKIADVNASNGVVHVIDKVLTMAAAPEESPSPSPEPDASSAVSIGAGISAAVTLLLAAVSY